MTAGSWHGFAAAVPALGKMQHRPSSGCGIFAIGPHVWAGISKILRLDVEEPEKPTMTTTGHHGICDQQTASHSVTPGLCNVTSASNAYWQFADTKEGSGLRDGQGALLEVDLDSS